MLVELLVVRPTKLIGLLQVFVVFYPNIISSVSFLAIFPFPVAIYSNSFIGYDTIGSQKPGFVGVTGFLRYRCCLLINGDRPIAIY